MSWSRTYIALLSGAIILTVLNGDWSGLCGLFTGLTGGWCLKEEYDAHTKP